MSSMSDISQTETMQDVSSYSVVETPAWTPTESRAPTPSVPQPNNPQVLLGVPKGLPADMHLRFYEGSDTHLKNTLCVPYLVWATAMQRLFCEHGVAPVMKDAVDPEARADYKKWGRASSYVRAANLNPWDGSCDLKLFYRADALINASISGKVAVWVAGIENPHDKWEALRQWFEPECLAELEKKKAAFDDLRFTQASGFAAVEGYVDTFMSHRTYLVSYGVVYSDVDCKGRLVENCLPLMDHPEAEAMRVRLMKEAESTTGDGTVLCRFAADFVKEAGGFWEDLSARRKAEKKARQEQEMWKKWGH